MRIFNKELIEKIRSLPDEKREIVLDGLARLYAVRPYRASEGLMVKTPPATKIAAEVYPLRK